MLKRLLKQLDVPVVLAPMAGVSTPKLVSAVSSQGGLGMHGGGFRNSTELASDIDAIAKGSNGHAFGVNLFFYDDHELQDHSSVRNRVNASLERLKPFYAKFNAQDLLSDTLAAPIDFDSQLRVVLEKKVPVFSFCFGCMPKDLVRELQANGTIVIGTATSVREARMLEENGVDGIAVQGADAGGHRGSFLADSSLVGTFSLVPQVVDAVRVPVIAAGGIMDARGVAAALALGADAVGMGTAFITCHESEAHRAHKDRILNSTDSDTIVTDVFSGRSARGFANEFTRTYAASHDNAQNMNRHHVTAPQLNVAPYPFQQSLTNPLKKHLLQHEPEVASEYVSMWAGQASPMAQSHSVASLLTSIREQITTK